METRRLLAADLAPPLLEQPAGEVMIPDGDFYLPGSISGRVFATSAADGVYQTGDVGIAGVRVELLASDGRLLAEVFTDVFGRYDFPALEPGEYAIRETQPSGFDDGPDWLGTGGGWAAANDLLSEIVVMPGADLTGFDFAERVAVTSPGSQETPPTTPGTEPTPQPTPMPIEEPASNTPLAGFVPLPTVEWRRSAATAVEDAVVESADAAPLGLAPLTPRRPERLSGSGGQPTAKAKVDIDAAISEGYEVLAAFFATFRGAEAAADPAAASVEAPPGQPVAAEASRNEARERAFEAEDPLPMAEAQTKPTVPTAEPQRRVDSSHQLAGKPAA